MSRTQMHGGQTEKADKLFVRFFVGSSCLCVRDMTPLGAVPA